MKQPLLLLLLTAWASHHEVCRGQVFDGVFPGLNRPIPDGNLAGVSDTRRVSALAPEIERVTVTINLVGTGSGAFNGDFYAYLSHGDELAILLNRPGRRAGNVVGYADNGLANVRFDDRASNGDVHNYRLTLFGNHNTALGSSPLTGAWAPDGRNVFPTTALDSDPRTATLSVFQGKDPNGDWTLFLADLESGGTGLLDSWSLEITAVPESAAFGLLGLGLPLLLCAYRLRRFLPTWNRASTPLSRSGTRS